MRPHYRFVALIALSLCLSLIAAMDEDAQASPALPVTDSTQMATITIPLLTKPHQIATGDVNMDTFPDIVVKSSLTAEFYLILNNGLSGFHTPVAHPLTAAAIYLNLKDFNNDGKLDLFYFINPTFFGPWTAEVRLGDGMGGFSAPVTSTIFNSPPSIVDIDFADFNNDAFLDFAVSMYGPGVTVPGGGALVALGNGLGGFTSNPFIGLRPRGSSLAAGDFNLDGKQDLAVLAGGASCTGCEPAMQFLFNNGTGSFPTSNIRTQSDYLHTGFTVGDMNNDGKPDVIGRRLTSTTYTIGTLLGTGAGDFVLGGSFSVGSSSPGEVRVADFNTDGKLDAAFTISSANLAYILYGDGLGGFTGSINLGTGITPNYFDLADFNRNGKPDMAISNSDSNYLTVLLDPNAPTPPPKTQYDFDGDLRADIAVYRDGNTPNAPSYWHILNSSNNTYQGIQHGANGDRPVPADYNGDGKTEVAVWRPSTGVWYTSTNASINYGAFHWGQAGDLPMPGDFDGDGRADRVVWRPSIGQWYVFRSSDGGFQQQQFGVSTDKPVLGDFDGDGKTDYAFYRPGSTALANSFWNVIQSSNGQFLSAQFGRGEDKPVPADYDGDGRINFAVFRPSTNTWYTSLNPSTNYGAVIWGTEGDVPAPADYDRDGRADVCIFRPGSGFWYIQRSADSAVLATRWGLAGDRPIPSSFIP